MRTSALQLFRFIPLLVVFTAALTSRQVFAAPAYTISVAGLSGTEHTRDDGYIFNTALEFNEAGMVLGSANRFNGGNINLGQSVWLFNGDISRDIGLTGSEHTRSDGYKFSDFEGVTDPDRLNEAGQVIGYARRYNGGDIDLGRSAWFYDGAMTTAIGLVDAEHTRADGYRYNYASYINETGHAVGGSFRYNGGTPQLGSSAWLFDGVATKLIGLTGPEFTRNDGYRFVLAVRINDAGLVTGISSRFNGGDTDLGRSAWLYDGSSTIELGLTGSAYIGSGGYKSSSIEALNSAGHVVGVTERFNGGSARTGVATWIYNGTTLKNISLPGIEASLPEFLNEAGQVLGVASRFGDTNGSAWFYNGATTISVGLTGPEHTRDNGSKSSIVLALSESGKSIGMSVRYLGGRAQLGNSAWLYNGVTTLNIGLLGPEHTQANGEKWSRPEELNEAGQVIGRSTRYNGNVQAGESVWLYDGSTTVELGLTGSKYTRSDGYERSGTGFLGAGFLNEVGQVLGSTERFDIAGGYSDAWLYDPVLGYFPLEFSTRSDGLWVTGTNYLGDDGLVLGSYRLFDASDNDLGLRAYSFTIAGGMHDLGALVEGGLSANGWEALAKIVRADSRGRIFGYGTLTAQAAGQMVYVLTPIPEPNTLLLTSLAIIPLTWRRRAVRVSDDKRPR